MFAMVRSQVIKKSQKKSQFSIEMVNILKEINENIKINKNIISDLKNSENLFDSFKDKIEFIETEIKSLTIYETKVKGGSCDKQVLTESKFNSKINKLK